MTRVAAWRETRWGGTGRGWITPTRDDAAAAESGGGGGGGGGRGSVPQLILEPALSLGAGMAELKPQEYLRPASASNSSNGVAGSGADGSRPL